MFDGIDFAMDHADLVEVARGWHDGRPIRAFLLNAGRCHATVMSGRVTLRRRFGVMGGACELSAEELTRLVTLLERWRRRRTRWPSWYWTRPLPHPLGTDFAWYQPPGASSKAAVIARVEPGPDRERRYREAIPGVERVVRVRAPTFAVADYSRVARIRRSGVPSDDPRGVQVGEVFESPSGFCARMIRSEVELRRGDTTHHVEPGDVRGLRALVALLGTRGTRLRTGVPRRDERALAAAAAKEQHPARREITTRSGR